MQIGGPVKGLVTHLQSKVAMLRGGHYTYTNWEEVSQFTKIESFSGQHKIFQNGNSYLNCIEWSPRIEITKI